MNKVEKKSICLKTFLTLLCGCVK